MSIELFKPDEYFNMEAMNSRLSSANTDISKESQRVSELQTSTSTEIGSLKARTTELETELPKVKEHLDNVDVAQQATATTLSSTRGDLATAQSNITTLQTNLATQTGIVSQHTQKIITLDGRVLDLELGVSALSTRVDTLNSSVIGFNGRVSTLESTASNLQNTVVTLNGEITTVNAKADATNTALSELTTVVSKKGDFRSDGSIPMTGNLNMSEKVITGVSSITGAYTTLNGVINTYITTGGIANIVGYPSGDISVLNHTIRSVKDPVNPQDAATKAYVDSRPTGTGDFKADGSIPMTGDLQMGGNFLKFDRTSTTGGIDLDYGNLIFKIFDDGTMEMFSDGPWTVLRTNSLDLWKLKPESDGVEIYGLPKVPTSPSSATSKAYVDSKIGSGGGGDFKADGSVPMTGPVSFVPATGKNELKNVRTIIGENGVKIDFWDAYGFQIYTDSYGILELNDGQLIFAEPTKLENLADPISPQGAATKAYVDSRPTGSGDFKSDGSVPMTGDIRSDSTLTLSSPTEIVFSIKGPGLEAYVDIDGLFMADKRIKRVAEPTESDDAATKAYVDASLGNPMVFSTMTPNSGWLDFTSSVAYNKNTNQVIVDFKGTFLTGTSVTGTAVSIGATGYRTTKTNVGFIIPTTTTHYTPSVIYVEGQILTAYFREVVPKQVAFYGHIEFFKS